MEQIIPTAPRLLRKQGKETQIAAIDTNVGGQYEVSGAVEDGMTVAAHIEVVMLNYAQNLSLGEADTDGALHGNYMDGLEDSYDT